MKMQPVGNQEEETVIMTGVSRETYEKIIHMFDNIPVTNFDKVTESPEKLAEWLAKHYDYCTYADCDNCPVNNEDGSCGNEGKTDYEIWLWWLKQESKE